MTTDHNQTDSEEPPEPPTDIGELCSAGRLGAAVMMGWGENAGVHPTVAYSCRAAGKMIDALVSAIHRLQKEATSHG